MALLFFFAFTLFVSATLLFLVQPMVGKMVLPRLGGTPAVWNTCMVFFQGVLLVGYAYTHTISVWQNRRRQLILQFVLLGLPFLVLPFSLGAWNPPADFNPALSVLWLLLGMVGVPFFVVATSAPLLQKWFHATGHPAAKDPYFLYGASNLGSMLALVLYPLVVEPNFSLETQTYLWLAGYAFMVALVVGCGVIVWQAPPTVALSAAPVAGAAAPPAPLAAPAPSPTPAATAITASRRMRHKPAKPEAAPAAAASAAAPKPNGELIGDGRITWARRLRWIGLAAAPSSLMLGVTTYLTTDIAAIPFFWIVPLALYLLTFILVFARWPVVWTKEPHTLLLYVQPCFMMFLVLILVAKLSLPTVLEFLIHLAAFFSTALVCHGELARDRPDVAHLTEFYLWMSVGGVLGGMFNALVAPPLFWFGVLEYYLVMVLACVLRPPLLSDTPLIPGDTTDRGTTYLGRALDLVIPLTLGGVAYLVAKWGTQLGYRSYLLAGGVVLVLALASRPLRFGFALGLFVLGVTIYDRGKESLIYEGRGFFGFVKVRREQEQGKVYHTLVHGGINHGQQIVKPHFLRRQPITYFHPTGGIGQVFEKFRWPDERLPASLAGLGAGPFAIFNVLVGSQSEPPYAVLGLGSGTLAAHARPWQHMVFYEIDPLVKRLSMPPEGDKAYFFYVQDALERGANLEVILGDGRLTLKKDPHVEEDPARKFENYYHILVLDAFSSDAIPVHLLTSEALDLYLSKLAEGGVLIFNTTNRFVDIRPVLADLAEAKGLECVTYGDYDDDIPDKFGSDWVVMRRTGPAANGGPPLDARLGDRWQPPEGFGGPIWTDSYSNLLRVMVWGATSQ